jgi:GTPase SAR1 family protein
MSEERYRLVVLGSAKVGKTSLIRRYLYQVVNTHDDDILNSSDARNSRINTRRQWRICIHVNFVFNLFHYHSIFSIQIVIIPICDDLPSHRRALFSSYLPSTTYKASKKFVLLLENIKRTPCSHVLEYCLDHQIIERLQLFMRNWIVVYNMIQSIEPKYKSMHSAILLLYICGFGLIWFPYQLHVNDGMRLPPISCFTQLDLTEYTFTLCGLIRWANYGRIYAIVVLMFLQYRLLLLVTSVICWHKR